MKSKSQAKPNSTEFMGVMLVCGGYAIYHSGGPGILYSVDGHGGHVIYYSVVGHVIHYSVCGHVIYCGHVIHFIVVMQYLTVLVVMLNITVCWWTWWSCYVLRSCYTFDGGNAIYYSAGGHVIFYSVSGHGGHVIYYSWN